LIDIQPKIRIRTVRVTLPPVTTQSIQTLESIDEDAHMKYHDEQQYLEYPQDVIQPPPPLRNQARNPSQQNINRIQQQYYPSHQYPHYLKAQQSYQPTYDEYVDYRNPAYQDRIDTVHYTNQDPYPPNQSFITPPLRNLPPTIPRSRFVNTQQLPARKEYFFSTGQKKILPFKRV
jgi:hypothetical protein